MHSLQLDLAQTVRTLHARFAARGHDTALADAICCVEDLAEQQGQGIDVVDGLTWPQWRSMHMALWAVFCTLRHASDLERSGVVATIAERARRRDGMVLPAVQEFLTDEVRSGRCDQAEADALFDAVDEAICAAFDSLRPWPRPVR